MNKKPSQEEICKRLYEHYQDAGLYNIAEKLFKCKTMLEVREEAYNAVQNVQDGEEWEEAFNLYYLIYEIAEKFFGIKSPCTEKRPEIPTWLTAPEEEKK